MIKAVSKEAALRYAENLEIEKNDYVIFDIGKNLLLVGGSEEAFTKMAEESVLAFARHFQAMLYDANENDDIEKLTAKTSLSTEFVEKMSEKLIKELENEHIFTAVVKTKGGNLNGKSEIGQNGRKEFHRHPSKMSGNSYGRKR